MSCFLVIEYNQLIQYKVILFYYHDLTYSGVSHRSLAPGFKHRPGYVRRVFHLSLPLITFGNRSAHLACLVHKSGRKTATFTFYIHVYIIIICKCKQ